VKFNEFEKNVSFYNEEYGDFYRKSQKIEKQNDIIQTRAENQKKLKDSFSFKKSIKS